MNNPIAIWKQSILPTPEVQARIEKYACMQQLNPKACIPAALEVLDEALSHENYPFPDRSTTLMFEIFCFNIFQDEKIQLALRVAPDSLETWTDFWTNLELRLIPDDDMQPELLDKPLKYNAQQLASMMMPLSLAMHCFDARFFPILMPYRHDIFTWILDQLGIDTPALPASTDHAGCMRYYFQLNEAINAFAFENELTPEEMIEAVYGFGYQIYKSEKREIADTIPAPTRIWWAGASRADVKSMSENPDMKESIWQCNEAVAPGDIIVLYAKAPFCGVHSIWRAKTGGFFNPFDDFHTRTTLCERIDIPKISLNELKEHELWADAPIIRKNFQGMRLFQVTPVQYRSILDMIDAKGGDSSKCPQIVMNPIHWNDDEIKLEKDVEEKILIPFLRELGYKDTDWKRQLKQKSGTSEKEIPDFVFFPHGEHLANDAPFLIEAKRDMKNRQETDRAFKQGRSYARMLKCKRFAICDRNRIIIFEADRAGRFDFTKPMINISWTAIDEEASASLRALIGPEAIRRLI